MVGLKYAIHDIGTGISVELVIEDFWGQRIVRVEARKEAI